MATQRRDGQIQFQPAQVYQSDGLGFAHFYNAQGWQNVAQGAQTAANQLQQQADIEAADQAQRDAPALIQRDGTGAVLPVASFDPTGITSRAYRTAYRNTAQALYMQSATDDFRNFAEIERTKNPTDLAAVGEALKTKKSSMLQTLDPAFAPIMSLKLNALEGQALSQVNMAVEKERIIVANDKAEEANAQFVLQASQQEGFDHNIPADALETNNRLLFEDWKKTVALMKGAGWSDDRIGRVYETNKAKIYAARYERDVRTWALQSGMDPVTGEIDPNATAVNLQGLREIADKAGVHADAVYSRLRAAYFEGAQIQGLRSQGIQQANNRDLINKQVAVATRASEVGIDDPQLQTSIRRELANTFMDPKLSGAAMLKQASMYSSYIGEGQQQISKAYTQQYVTLSAAMDDVKAPPAQREAARSEMQSIVNDPVLQSSIPPGVRSAMHGQLRAANIRSLSANYAAFQGEAQRGILPPEQIDMIGEKMIASGIVGDGGIASIPDFQKIRQAGAQAWLKRQDAMGHAAVGLENWQKKGVPPTPMQTEAIEGMPETGFTLPQGVPANIKSPDFRKAVGSYFASSGVLPKVAKDQLANVPMGADPEATMAAHELFRDVLGVQTSRGLPREKAIAQMDKLIGPAQTTYLSRVGNVGYDVATAQAQKAGTGSDSKNLGAGEAVHQTKLAETIDTFALEVGPTALGHYQAQFNNMLPDWIPGGGGDRDAWAGKYGQMAEALLKKSSLDPGWYSAIFKRPTPTATFSPDLRSMLYDLSDNILRTEGQAFAARLGEGGARKAAVAMAVEQLQEIIDVAPNADDPRKLEFVLKRGNTAIGQALGLEGPASNEVTQSFLSGLIRAGTPENSMLAYDDNSLAMDLRVDSTGGRYWVITGLQAGVPKPIAEIDYHDPRLGALGALTSKTASQLMRKHWRGISDGDTPNPSEMSYVSGLMAGSFGDIVRTVGGPMLSFMEGDLRERVTKELVMRMSDDSFTDKILRRFGQNTRDRVKPDGKTNWVETLRSIQGDKSDETRDIFRRMKVLQSTMP